MHFQATCIDGSSVMSHLCTVKSLKAQADTGRVPCVHAGGKRCVMLSSTPACMAGRVLCLNRLFTLLACTCAQIRVNQEERQLIISGERRRPNLAGASSGKNADAGASEQERSSTQRRKSERRFGKFERKLGKLPEDADLDAVTARYRTQASHAEHSADFPAAHIRGCFPPAYGVLAPGHADELLHDLQARSKSTESFRVLHA